MRLGSGVARRRGKKPFPGARPDGVMNEIGDRLRRATWPDALAGAGEGRALLVITVLFAVAALITAFTFGRGQGNQYFWGQALVVSMGLLAMGMVCTRLYGWAVSLQERLALVGAVAVAVDARAGVEAVAQCLLRRLRDHYDAEICLLALTRPRQASRLFCIEAGDEKVSEFSPPDAEQLLPTLLAVPAGQGVVYNSSGIRWSREAGFCQMHGEPLAAGGQREVAEAVAATLDCPSFIGIPLARDIRIGGRLLIGARRRRFGGRDVDFLRSVVEHATLMLENTLLVDMLVAEAAENERQRLARDLHDSAVQPYIGLRFGLEALARKARHDRALSADIQHLIERTAGEIADMRQLIGGLNGAAGGNSSLLASLRRQATRFGELFGISVELSAEEELRVGGSLAREILHMVGEGLSNVCRHTRAGRARISLRRRGDSLELRVANDFGAAGKKPGPFMPGSLHERAAALGGEVGIDLDDGGETVVRVSIPLPEKKP